uniref:BRCA1 associated RING domain 1 n=1 Tax=Varanus komodoensis TaxID=61221 RepID=A0A8D2LYY4_VARKO
MNSNQSFQGLCTSCVSGARVLDIFATLSCVKCKWSPCSAILVSWYSCKNFRCFCHKLTCVGDSIGAACPVCHTPAMVQDVKVNRQLESIIKLYIKLQSLQNRDFTGTQDNLSAPGEVDHEAGTKKQIKMWFSPRSRKMRFTLKRPEKPEQMVSDKDSQPHLPASAYDFISSTPPQEPCRKVKKSQPKCKKQLTKKTLTDLNQQWGLLRGRQENVGGQNEGNPSEAKESVVSFCSQTVMISSPNPKSTFEHQSTVGFVQHEDDFGMGGDASVISMEKTNNDNLFDAHDVAEEPLTSEECLPSGREMAVLKRGRQQMESPASLAKRSRTKEQRTSRRASLLKESPRQSLRNSLGKLSSLTPTASILTTLRNSKDFQHASSQIATEISTSSTNLAQKEAKEIALFTKKFPNNLSTKRNHKGETLLHVASIEGDLYAVEQLLKDGADPNVKDYAGWTPLHEACNHGHKEVVELLLQHGALLNATGYQNDLPLHDAVKNGHTGIVELLLLRGASRDAVNIFGHKPMDYAETEKMKSLLMLPVNNESSIIQCAEKPSQKRREEPIVFLGSGLDPVQQQLLSKLAVVLKARISTEFINTVTHVVIPEYPVRSTMKCMLAVLTGCWILTFEWVKACLQTGAREQEEKYEIDCGSRRGRLNKEQLLPKLFDGCYFYFLGTFKEPNKEKLKELVKTGGGQILMRKPKPDNDVTQTVNTVAYHAEITSDQSFCTQYIVYDASSSYHPEKVRQGKVWEVSSKWLIDCVMSFQLLPVEE